MDDEHPGNIRDLNRGLESRPPISISPETRRNQVPDVTELVEFTGKLTIQLFSDLNEFFVHVSMSGDFVDNASLESAQLEDRPEGLDAIVPPHCQYGERSSDGDPLADILYGMIWRMQTIDHMQAACYDCIQIRILPGMVMNVRLAPPVWERLHLDELRTACVYVNSSLHVKPGESFHERVISEP
ncbi:hypothetical protein SODALDRAFT_364459 [Sodiomyces alkalinus F11]|uniref:Uncharacterized protein n=1 Tax=Sodiomyces alkalinus (strain CBS 110278 / VKM F-3762 / F11) TaxID=1314773 RepID=A0A3N2PJ12_SODAK|nr:hypothetical protein SODALDRAFT_364459 [Sodiomyces alkalinus F11]ROT34532.1 hypothetical protein SODALDRAFT_364459 [Sodiomyces alkalinus F11]